MTPKAQQIAIAETCGYLKHHPCKHCGNDCGWMAPTGAFVQFDGLPDYLSDLNAMHEAEKVLTEEQQAKYYSSRSWECFAYGIHSIRHRNTKIMASATAAQRAEVFLKCLDLWDEMK